MFTTSKDILYLVISFCIIWLTVFLCWMFYYLMRLLRNANQIVEEFRMRLQTLMDIINNIHGKVNNISDFLAAATGGVGGYVKNVVSRKAKEWVGGQSRNFDSAAKDAVDKAVEATASGIKKMAKKMKK